MSKSELQQTLEQANNTSLSISARRNALQNIFSTISTMKLEPEPSILGYEEKLNSFAHETTNLEKQNMADTLEIEELNRRVKAAQDEITISEELLFTFSRIYGLKVDKSKLSEELQELLRHFRSGKFTDERSKIDDRRVEKLNLQLSELRMALRQEEQRYEQLQRSTEMDKEKILRNNKLYYLNLLQEKQEEIKELTSQNAETRAAHDHLIAALGGVPGNIKAIKEELESSKQSIYVSNHKYMEELEEYIARLAISGVKRDKEVEVSENAVNNQSEIAEEELREKNTIIGNEKAELTHLEGQIMELQRFTEEKQKDEEELQLAREELQELSEQNTLLQRENEDLSQELLDRLNINNKILENALPGEVCLANGESPGETQGIYQQLPLEQECLQLENPAAETKERENTLVTQSEENEYQMHDAAIQSNMVLSDCCEKEQLNMYYLDNDISSELITQYEKELSQQTEEFANIKQSVSQLKDSMRNMECQFNSNYKEISDDLREELGNSLTSYMNLQNELQKSEVANKQLLQSNDQKEELISELQEEVRRNEDVRKNSEKIEIRSEEILSQLEESTKSCIAIEDQLARKKEEVEYLNEEITEQNISINFLQEKLARLQENQENQQEEHDTQIKTYKQQFAELDALIKAQEDKIEQYKDEGAQVDTYSSILAPRLLETHEFALALKDDIFALKEFVAECFPEEKMLQLEESLNIYATSQENTRESIAENATEIKAELCSLRADIAGIKHVLLPLPGLDINIMQLLPLKDSKQTQVSTTHNMAKKVIVERFEASESKTEREEHAEQLQQIYGLFEPDASQQQLFAGAGREKQMLAFEELRLALDNKVAETVIELDAEAARNQALEVELQQMLYSDELLFQVKQILGCSNAELIGVLTELTNYRVRMQGDRELLTAKAQHMAEEVHELESQVKEMQQATRDALQPLCAVDWVAQVGQHLKQLADQNRVKQALSAWQSALGIRELPPAAAGATEAGVAYLAAQTQLAKAARTKAISQQIIDTAAINVEASSVAVQCDGRSMCNALEDIMAIVDTAALKHEVIDSIGRATLDEQSSIESAEQQIKQLSRQVRDLSTESENSDRIRELLRTVPNKYYLLDPLETIENCISKQESEIALQNEQEKQQEEQYQQLYRDYCANWEQLQTARSALEQQATQITQTQIINSVKEAMKQQQELQFFDDFCIRVQNRLMNIDINNYEALDNKISTIEEAKQELAEEEEQLLQINMQKEATFNGLLDKTKCLINIHDESSYILNDIVNSKKIDLFKSLQAFVIDFQNTCAMFK